MVRIVKAAIRSLCESYPRLDLARLSVFRGRYLRSWFRRGPSKSGSPSGKTFLILNHCYDLDADALCASATDHTIWVLDPFKVFTHAHHMFPQGQRDLDCVYAEGEMASTVARYRKNFIRPLAERLIREIQLDAFIVPSDTFYWVRALIDEFHDRGIPTLVQDKEGTLSEGTMNSNHSQILAERYPPISDRYYFWNENQRKFWLKVGLSPSKIEVLGQPRSDFFHHPDRWPSKDTMGLSPSKKLLTFFTFDADAYSGEMHVGRGVDRYPWREMRTQIHDVLRTLLKERDDIQIVVKAHPQQTDLNEVKREFELNPVPGMTLQFGASTASHLIVQSEVIIGFQTTALIEAMTTNLPVIYAGWGKDHDILDPELLPIHHSRGCFHARNPSELRQMAEAALNGNLKMDASMQSARKAFCNRYFFQADGNASVRILDSASRFIDQYRREI